MMFTKVW